MKVQDLITHLQQYNPNDEIFADIIARPEILCLIKLLKKEGYVPTMSVNKIIRLYNDWAFKKDMSGVKEFIKSYCRKATNILNEQ